MEIRPLHDRIILKRIEEERKTAGGIVIPDTAAEKPSQGEVVYTGPGKTDENGNFTLPDVAAGTYTISARLKDAGTARQNLTVHGTSATEVTLTLKQRVVRSKPRKPAA